MTEPSHWLLPANLLCLLALLVECAHQFALAVRPRGRRCLRSRLGEMWTITTLWCAGLFLVFQLLWLNWLAM